MIDEPSPFGGSRLGPVSFRVLKAAEMDPDYAELDPKSDLQLLSAFLERFARLGWIPPLTEQKRALLDQYGVIMHQVADLVLYEYCAMGGRGEREPWLTIFFHLDMRHSLARICGVAKTSQLVGRNRSRVWLRVVNRANDLAARLGAGREVDE